MSERQYFVYILTNRRGTLYTGVTNDLVARVRQHRGGGKGFTAKYRIGKLVYFESSSDAYSAIAREKQIKGWLRERKLELIRTVNPAFRDLAPDLGIGDPFLFPGRARLPRGRVNARRVLRSSA